VRRRAVRGPQTTTHDGPLDSSGRDGKVRPLHRDGIQYRRVAQGPIRGDAMSHGVAITITLQTPTEYGSTLEALEAAGWEIRDTTGSSFIREDATDPSDWLVFQSVTSEAVRRIVAARDELRQCAGVVLMYSGTLHGCNFLWIDRNTLVVSPNINRVELSAGWVDFNWYLQRVCQPLQLRGFDMEPVDLYEGLT